MPRPLRAIDTATQRLAEATAEEDPTYKDAAFVVICVKTNQTFEMVSNCLSEMLPTVLMFGIERAVKEEGAEKLPRLT